MTHTNRKKPWNPANFGKWAHKALQMSEADLSRAKKISALAVRGATDGEKAAAMHMLNKIAQKAGTTADVLLSIR